MVTLLEAICARNNELITGDSSKLEKDISEHNIKINPENVVQSADYIGSICGYEYALNINLGIFLAYKSQQIKEERQEAVYGLIEGIKYIYGIEKIPRALRTIIICLDTK